MRRTRFNTLCRGSVHSGRQCLLATLGKQGESFGFVAVPSTTTTFLGATKGNWAKSARSLYIPPYPPHIQALWAGKVIPEEGEKKPEEEPPPDLDEVLRKVSSNGRYFIGPCLKADIAERLGITLEKGKKKRKKKKASAAKQPNTRKERIEAILQEFLKPMRMMVEDLEAPKMMWDDYVRTRQWYHGVINTKAKRRGRISIYVESFLFVSKTPQQREQWVKKLVGKYLRTAEKYAIKTVLPANPEEAPDVPTPPRPYANQAATSSEPLQPPRPRYLPPLPVKTEF